MDWLDSLARLKISAPASFGSQGNPQGYLTAALTASLPGADTSQPSKGVYMYSAVRPQLIKTHCSPSSKTWAAVIEKGFPFFIPLKSRILVNCIRCC